MHIDGTPTEIAELLALLAHHPTPADRTTPATDTAPAAASAQPLTAAAEPPEAPTALTADADAWTASALRAHRAHLDLSIERAAGLLGVTYRTLSNWERGVTRPDPRGLRRIAAAYGHRPTRREDTRTAATTETAPTHQREQPDHLDGHDPAAPLKPTPPQPSPPAAAPAPTTAATATADAADTRTPPPGRGGPRPRTAPAAIGDPGADRGDGLDIFRVDGRLLAAARRPTTGGAANTTAGITDLDWARLAARREELLADGRITSVDAALGAILGRTPAAAAGLAAKLLARDLIGGGRRATRHQPHRFHHLTDHARQLLHDAGDPAPPPPPPAPAPETANDPSDTPPATPVPPAPAAATAPPPAPAPTALEPPAADSAQPPPALAPPPQDPAALTTERPTAVQQALIDALTDTNRAHVARLRAAAGPRRTTTATLPTRCHPVTNASLPRELRDAAGAARRAGWAIGKGASGHVEWFGPHGEKVRTSSTIGDVMGAKLALRDLRAAGIPC